MESHLRYRTGYSTNGDSCKGCSSYLRKDDLYLAVMIQSRQQDTKYPVPYHVRCFFSNQRLTTAADVAGFEKLRTKDQNSITKYIDRHNTAVIVQPKVTKGDKKAPKRLANEPVQMSKKALRDFGIEYSKSGRAQCCGCRQKIPKGVVRCKKVIYNSEVGMQFGGQPLWHHFDCFVKLKMDLGWYGGADQLPGFYDLKEEDQKMVLDELSSSTLDEVPVAKKGKPSSKEQKKDKEIKQKLKEQNDLYFEFRDTLQKNLPKSNWIKILEINSQNVPTKNEEILDAVADILTYGSLKPCSVCNGQLIFDKFGYSCTGSISEWAKCDNHIKEPPRIPCKIQKRYEKHFPNYHSTVSVRACMDDAPTTSTIRKVYPSNTIWEAKVQREKPPLYQLEIATIGALHLFKRPELKEKIEKMGGKLTTKIHERTFVILSDEKEVKRMNHRMQTAKEFGIQVVTEHFVDDVENGMGAVDFIKTYTICDWGNDPTLRLYQDEPNGKIRSMYTLSVPKSMTLKLVDGAAVDPASGLQNIACVYIENDKRYQAVLNLTDIQNDLNSYFKIQLLEANNKNQYWIFSSWGRIGTNIGSTNLCSFGNIDHAKTAFSSMFNEKTGNSFTAKTFHKKAGKYLPIDIDYTSKKIKEITDRPDLPSALPSAVQKLIKMMFDVNMMKRTMVEFELDMEKMPLGKLSQKQLTEALGVLREISELIAQGGTNAMFVGASNHFYSLIPHDFGIQCPPVLSTVEVVKNKTEMIETLIEMEIAYSLLQSDTNTNVSPLDNHYAQLKTDIQPLDPSTEEFELINRYLQNTHASTHSNYKLNIEDIFTVKRDGEEDRYETFKSLHNRRLLWHGSRLTNYVGILSHGLKIAPPEAPSSGYMFGKGIYFADMVSKSANYCFSSSNGLLLLCEVALGNMKECLHAQNIVRLPQKMHSTKGIGQTYPNPIESHFTKDGVEIPLGVPVTDLDVNSSLLYNEYIVYDVSQVNVKYLLKVNFNQIKQK